MSCLVCSVNNSTRLLSDSKLSVSISVFNHGLSSRLSGISKIGSFNGTYRSVKSRVSSFSALIAKENVNFSPKGDLSKSGNAAISATTIVNFGVKDKVPSSSNFQANKTDKFAGYKPAFRASSKLYPIADISFKNKFTNENIVLTPTSNIYSYIDDGVFTLSYVQNNEVGYLVSDDAQSVTFPSQVFSSGDLEYKLRVSYPLAHPQFSYFALRASAPFDNYILRRPQEYKIYDITLEDPSGNLIIKYDDILIKGDNSFTTYISKPSINNVNQTTWSSGYPYMDSGSPLFLETKPYVLTLNLSYDCNQYPFSDKFNFGYEQTCIKDSFTNIDNPNPFNSLLISSIEIGNSGGVGIKKDNYLNCFTSVRSKSERIQKIILPKKLFTTDFNNGIYPEASSIWKTPDNLYTNQEESQSEVLLQRLRRINTDYGDYITLSGSLPYVDSGRLLLKFDTDRDTLNQYTDGAFRFGGNKSFNDSKLVEYKYEDYFDIDYVELKVIARKPVGGPDYTIDVVGYSDDKLLHVTSPVGGFLQNSGSIPFSDLDVPDVSGFNYLNFGFSNGSISDQSEYFSTDVSPLGDHYIINDSVLIDSTDFETYIIPLEIYQDPRKFGRIPYSLSSYFENLYLDICPIPSGASIAHISLILYYKPANALTLHTLGSPSNKNAVQKSINLLPDSYGTISSNVPLSGIIAGFLSPSNLASNFSRRWRGNTGDIYIGGDFKRNNFDFSFNHKQSDVLFLTSYVDFNNCGGSNVYSSDGSLVGNSVIGDLNIISNFGWRYTNSNDLSSFSSTIMAQDYSRDLRGNNTYYAEDGSYIEYSPEDGFWVLRDVDNITQIVDYFNNDPIYDEHYFHKSISYATNTFDNFDKALLLENDYISTNLMSGSLDKDFTLFIRYTPNNLSSLELNEHVIASCYSGGNDTWGMVIVVEESFIKVKIKTYDGEIITLSDNYSVSEYTFPLSILVTYDSGNNKLRLYTNNEAGYLRDTNLVSFVPESMDISNTFIGFSDFYADQPSRSIFVHELGYSNSYSIVESTPNRFLNQIFINDFFDSYKVSATNIDDDISMWKLGDFKTCSFSPAFDSYTKREGKDYITFNLNHHGSGYSQFTDRALPSNVKLSGVSYHTQIENDFLRFEISDIPSVDQDRFHAITPRISKALPKGYNFREQALYIETILEHETSNDMLWPNGKSGPKFIVSLYAPTQDDAERPSKSFGLTNRSSHYLEPSGCIRKITSKFTFEDILDKSEPWADFDVESYSKEFKEKYFLNDINQMFLQYDLVYPSGSPYQSKIKIHNTNIKSNNAIYLSDTKNAVFPLYTSGTQYQFTFLNLFTPENGIPISGGYFNLYVNSHPPIRIHESGLSLVTDTSGYWTNPESVSLYAVGNGLISSDFGEPTFGSMFGSSPMRGLGLSVSGEYMVETTMPLHTYGMAYNSYNSLNFVTVGPMGSIVIEDTFPLRIKGINPSFNAFPASSMSLHVYNNQTFIGNTDNSFNLYLSGFNLTIFDASGSLPLVTLNYPISDSLASYSSTITWDRHNVGQSIVSRDNIYAYVDADDNIRGVELSCYGDCNQ